MITMMMSVETVTATPEPHIQAQPSRVELALELMEAGWRDAALAVARSVSGWHKRLGLTIAIRCIALVEDHFARRGVSAAAGGGEYDDEQLAHRVNGRVQLGKMLTRADNSLSFRAFREAEEAARAVSHPRWRGELLG